MAGITLSDLTFDPLKNVDLATRLDTDQPSVGEAMQARPVGAAVRAAQGLNTDTVARHNALAQKMQLPMGTVRRRFSEAQQQDMIRRIEARPELAAFAATSPERAALYIDDPDAWDVVWERVANMPEAIGQAWDIGRHNQQFAALGKEFMDAPEDRLEELRGRMAAHRKERQAFIPVDSYADEIALTTAVEQLPRMADMLPTQAGAAALAGMGGAVAGSVVPGLGTVAAATASARAGWLTATAYTAFEAERDSTIADFALLQDEDGQYMSRDDVVGAATIYAAGAAAIETAGEAFFLSLAKPFLGSLAEKIAPKAFVKTAVQRAMMNKSTRAAVLDIAKRIGQNALAEGGEESLQGLLQDVMQIVAMAKSDEHGNTSFGPQTVFKTETVKNIVENFGAGFGAGLWLGGVPMITLGAKDVVAAHKARLWTDEQKKLHAEVDATKVKAASPELTQAMLEEGPKLEGNVVIPADALMELHQQDTLILPALGMEEKAVQQAADMGQELTVPRARLHASLDKKQGDAVLDIAREEPQAMNAVEAGQLPERLNAIRERAVAVTAAQQEEERLNTVEVNRLREELREATSSVPGLRTRLESGEGLQQEAAGVERFVEDNLRVIEQMARYLADETGRPIAEFLRPITYEGLAYDPSGKLVPVSRLRDAERLEEERARAEADRPFWELVWGRVDPESLKADYAETYKELRKTKRGLFMPAGRGGVPLDQIADELNERGIFTGSADDLLDRLKIMERPRRGYYQEGLSLQQQDSAVDVVYPNNGLVVGEVTPEMAETLHLNKPGRIVLNDQGVQHIEEEHGQQIRSLGFSGPQAFVEAVLENVTAVYAVKDNRRKYDLVCTTMQPQGRVMVRLEFEAKGDFYSISTAGPLRKDYFKNKTPLWVKAQSSRSENSEPLGTPRAITGQSSISENSIAQGGEEVNSLEQRAFHGSPHRFMKFMLEHIGSGEGAQAHGWGLYFAKNREVAENYKNNLARTYMMSYGGNRFEFITPQQLQDDMGREVPETSKIFAIMKAIDEADGDKQKARQVLEERLPAMGLDELQAEDFWNIFDDVQASPPTPTLYEVDIPENDVLLDEDLRITDQPETVRKALEQLLDIYVTKHTIAVLNGVEYEYDHDFEQWENTQTYRAEFDESIISQLEASKHTVTGLPRHWHGYQAYEELADVLGSPREASLALNEAGVKGITYDGRQDGRCFVIFDDQAIDMLDTFYQFIGEEGAARLDMAEDSMQMMDRLWAARSMEKAGDSPAKIKLATGWERGKDGLWRFELDDSQAQYRKYGDARLLANAEYARKEELWQKLAASFGTDEELADTELEELDALTEKWGDATKVKMERLEANEGTLGDILHHPVLFTAYPQLANVRVTIEDTPGTSGQAVFEARTLDTPKLKKIVLSKGLIEYGSKERILSTIMHEVQHAIQAMEGHAMGGAPETMDVARAQQYADLQQQMQNLENELAAIENGKAIFDAYDSGDMEALDNYPAEDVAKADALIDQMAGLEKRMIRLQKMTDFEAYRSVAGEVEARNTQKRMAMTAEERLRSLAEETEDVAREDQMVIWDGIVSFSQGRTKGVTRGATVPTPTAMGMDYVVRLFKHANLSTLAHESSHVFFLQMKQLVDEGQASPRMQADYAALCRWVGSKDGFLNRDQHEKLAKGMELFLREGKAPSKKLEGAFGRFRRWLTEVYKAITGPYFQDEKGRQITLNPEVREVFSRILATQEEVARQAADEVIGRDFSAELDKLGVTGAQRVAITGLVKEAKDMAETRLHEAREAGRRAMQAKWKKEAEAQVAEERIYKARKAMRNSGMNMLALASAVGNEAAGEFFRKLPGIKREGANPWAFAASFGYDSVDQMVQEMLSTPSKAERVDQLVAEKQAEHDKQFKAQSLIASDQAAAMEEMVQEHIINAMGGKERGVALAQIKQAAREYLGGLPMDDAINSGKFRYQAIRLMHMEREAIMSQDYARAMDINFKLRLNMELTRQSQELRDKTLGLVRRAQKFTASKIHDPVCRYAVAFLAMKVNLLAESKMIARTAQDKDLDMVEAWAAEATDYGYTYEMDHELWYGQLNPWRQMGVGQFDRVYRQLTQIMTIEQNMRQMDTWQGQVELKACAADLANHILDKDPTRQKVGVEGDSPKVHKLKKFFNVLQVSVPTRLRLWDDDKPLGKTWQLIMRPMQEARNDELRRFEKAAAQIRAIIGEAYSHEELMAMKDKQYDDFMGESISKERRLLVLLNLGNVGNKNRLLEGFRDVRKGTKWTQAHIDAMIAPLEKKDYDFAQKVWDHFEQYKKERFDQEEALTGVRPLEVEATPLKTRFGTYRGGYFPIKYDKDRGARAASYDKTSKSVNSMLPTVAHGAMKDRQDKGLGSPLKLTFSVITDAVAESVHDLAYRRPVIEVAKLLRQHDVQRAMEDTQGAMVYKQMWDWLNDLAGERPAQNSLDNVASWARSRMALFAMGFKLTTTLLQSTGLLVTGTQIGWKWTMRGVQDTFRHGGTWSARAVWEDTKARSVMMRNRLQSFDRDVLALTQDLTEAGSSNKFLDPLFRADDWVKKHAFTLTGWVQLWAADIPTWRGAFLKGLEELGMDEKEAALYADTMVETAQGSGATKDLSEIMRSEGMTQFLTVFFSYFNALYNMFYRAGVMALRHKDMPHSVHLASMALVLWFVEPAITAWLTNKGPDDDEEWWEWWLKQGLQQPFQMIVGVRDISNMLWNYIDGKFGQGYRFSPAADVIEAFGKTAIDLHRVVDNAGEDYDATKKAAKRLARDVGMISGTPLLGAQMQTTLGNMWDWLDGTEEFALQDMFFTRKK